ncbi:MAG TPA: protein phosphatase CheZ [Patescibacteria group bacterium]|nr:protein phosphatase CheZ [Patescibacteria group bacterium]
MHKGTDKKLFTAELQRMKAKGLAPSSSEPTQVSNIDNAEVMAAIGSLRADIRALELLMRGEEADIVHHDPVAQAAEKKRVEVNMLKTELRALAVCIEQTKAEIAALRPTNSDDDRLMAVTNELDAIVTATERATDGILASAEKIDTLASQLQAQAGDGFSAHIAEDIREAVVGIFEECNFQDITGQRITKVVKTLQYIEDRVNKMIDIWGADNFDDLPPPPEVHEDEEKKLLNGPALENQGISQSDIDKLFD